MKIIYEFDNCMNCPYCKEGRSYGNDGRDGDHVFYCGKGAFGYINLGYVEGKYKGYSEVRENIIPDNCPLRKNNKSNDNIKEKSFTLICNNCGNKVVIREGFQGYTVNGICVYDSYQDIKIVCECGNGIKR